ncbi:RsmB/NOP family class I SAM-dependent RNA methyltransferase [Botrimarina mediterranea]|uniref:Ribosomal RNA small subunit methyltransferase F n=1 Tax=Botrimarina mediterranea TaxID=2528022 RepID=A0A518K5W5_9BACT|nr:RsmB/NOP family class I SAM-dependent RNA methyltransferase [Botrimarina mediterranea]QDV73180.1 Ribosomal RNA small subunit methyltransferase F [Botrimarina mediterranea]QDV77753.1 Ribosomal RNA small subunit methyltransferase F [Planctomycetes bacterium K2D]
MIEIDDAYGLPCEFVGRLRAVFGERAEEVLRTFGETRRPGAWANPLRSDDADPLVLMAEVGVEGRRCEWLPEAATIESADKSKVTESAIAADGRLYVQNLSSMLAPLVLDPQPGETVLDLAAAPGGKTLHLAARMRLEGELAAVEPVRDRFFKLRQNLERCGAGEFVRTFTHDGRDVGRKTPERFDAVLLDAPCSSEARFDPQHPGTFAYWGPRKLAESARKQKALLRSALDATRPGGRVLYCTCSFAPEENELVVAHTLRRLAGVVEIEPIDLSIGDSQMAGLTAWQGKRLPDVIAETVRIVPDDRLAGFYLAMLRKID